jgi:hypothetical protein
MAHLMWVLGGGRRADKSDEEERPDKNEWMSSFFRNEEAYVIEQCAAHRWSIRLTGARFRELHITSTTRKKEIIVP